MNLFNIVVASKLFKSLSAKSNLQTMVMKGLGVPDGAKTLQLYPKTDLIDPFLVTK